MRILIVKTSSLGDVIHHCPAISDVRRHFPGAAIDWVVEESIAEVVALHPAVRRAIPVAVRRWRSRLLLTSVWAEMLAFRRALRAETYDLIIDTQGLVKSALITSSARGTKHGFDAASAREPLASRFYDIGHSVSRETHAVERNRALTAAALGIGRDAEFDYGLVPRADNPIALDTPFCVLLSMSSRADKLWPEEHWAGLARALAAQGWQCVLPWGTESEQTRCHRIVESAGTGIVPRAMSLGELASLMNRAHAVFGVDTGLAHLAAALRVPVVGLYRGTDPALTGLYGDGKLANLGGPGRMPSVEDALAAVKALV